LIKINRFDIWLADLNPQIGTETGKVRPVLILQSNILNKYHGSTIVIPITTNIQSEAKILRIHLSTKDTGLKENCDVMLDQIRAIDNKRLIKKIGKLPESIVIELEENLKIILGMDL
jgi:mRNA interferase MazF